MSDLIKRLKEAVINAHNEGYNVGYFVGKLEYERKWIPVTEMLPDKHENVLVYSTKVGRGIDFITNDGNWYTIPKVTHWMPLPELPKGE